MKNRRYWQSVVGLGLFCSVIGLAAPRRAEAQLSGATGTTTGSSCTPANNADGSCLFSRNTEVSTGTNFRSRYAWNINADTGALSTRTTSGTATHNVSFTATAPGWYRVTIATSRLGDMNRISDALLCNGSSDVSGVTGSSNIALTTGTLNLADPGAIGNGGSTTSTAFNQPASATIDRASFSVGQSHSLTFTWNGNVRSNSCEAAVRVGEGVGTTTGCSACAYPGSPARTQATDGHFVDVTFQSFCGDGIVQGGFGEACDLGSANGALTNCCNLNCSFRASSQTCRTSAGPCDPAENCTGSGPNCPADILSGTGTVCRPSGGVCDIAENCSGSSPGCGFDFKQSSFTNCRAAADICDAPENCDGINNACPGDGKVGTATVCRASAGVCDVAENCDGVNNACPAQAFQSTSTICRPAAGVCDLAENCTGSGPACPANAKSTAVCRPAAGVCDILEQCDGVGNNCPPDSVSGAFVVCRPSSDICDKDDHCDGIQVVCPTDSVQGAFVTCRASAGICDITENCDGINKPCPTDVFVPSSTICRPDSGQCDVVENCTGSSAPCPPDGFEPATTPCDDNDFCTFGDECDGNNNCVSGINVNTTCDPCEACDPGTGNCIAGPRTDCLEPTVPGKSRVLISDRSPDRGDVFVWKWIKGEATTLADFGSPNTTDGYTLCVFDDGTEVFRSTINPGGTCGTLPCWRTLGSSGFKYINRDRTPDGILKTLLKAGTAGKAKIVVKGKGDNLPYPPAFLPMATPVQVQLQNETPGICWQSTYLTTGPFTNTIDTYKAVSEGPTP